MVYKGKPYFLMDDLGGKPTILGNPHLMCSFFPNPDSWIPDFGNSQAGRFWEFPPFHCTVGVADECRNLGHLQQQGSYCCESGVVAKGYLADVY